MLWKTEHGSEFDVPEELVKELARLGFTDESWHNDVSPVFRKYLDGTKYFAVWCSHPNPEEREIDSGTRFAFTESDSEGNYEDTWFEHDDWRQLVAFIERFVAEFADLLKAMSKKV